jgi:succinate-semialdehyde dehydrogenase/glutarate-semialdehyde dehydrogenase
MSIEPMSVIDADSYEKLALFIDGQWLSGEGRREQEVTSPADGSVLGRLPHATRRDLEVALAAAQRAFGEWRRTSPLERGQILRRVAELARERAEAIGRNMTLDQGKPLAEAVAEVRACADHAEWHAEECRRIYGRLIPPRVPRVRQSVTREPVGVVAAFTPWNFPFNQAIRKIAAALGAGCTIVLKGPEDSPSAVMALARLFDEAGCPAGCVNLVWGIPAEISDFLIRSTIVRKISFTGSIAVGKHLAALAGAHMKRVTMELGGHTPVIIFSDADVESAARLLVQQKFRNAGQVCVAPTRFYIQEEVYDRFMATFLEEVERIKVGNGLDPTTRMGPLAHERRISSMLSFVDDAVSAGAHVECGGERIGSTGSFFAPTVVTGVADSAQLMKVEPFGPIAPIARFSEFEDVMARANGLPYGLAAAVFTGSAATAQAAAASIESGMVTVNHWGLGLAETPFGGVKESGVGSEGGTETFDGYLVTKFVTERH